MMLLMMMLMLIMLMMLMMLMLMLMLMLMVTQSSPQHSLVGELMNKFGFSDILEYQVGSP